MRLHACLSLSTTLILVSVAFAAAASDVRESESQPQADAQLPKQLQLFIEAKCLDCHVGDAAEGGLDLESLSFDLDRRDVFERWTLIHDRVRDGEMPPPDDGVPVRIVPFGWSSQAADADGLVEESQSDGEQSDEDPKQMLKVLAQSMIQHDQQRIDAAGRAKVRRLNRYEYENTLREVLDAPWLQISQSLPEDGIAHLFNKSGERLDTSHVQVTRYLAAADEAVRLAVSAAAHPTQTRKFYAREESSMENYLHYRFGQMAALRSIVPLVGTTPEPDVIRKTQPLTVGDADPEKRELEAMGVFSGVYSATTKYDFTNIDAPTDGRYRLRFKTYSFMAGPNGADGGNDHGLTGGNRDWWRPDRNEAFPGNRTEPITLYALSAGGDSRWLTTFDSTPEPSVFESVVELKKGENIRPDAARLVRTRPGWAGNPVATQEGVPGFAMNWLEVEGPLHESWPPPSYQAVFADLPFEVTSGGSVKAISADPPNDARRLLTSLYQRAVVGDPQPEKSVEPFLALFHRASAAGHDFTDAMIASVSAILCSPDFFYLDAHPGPLPEHALQQRLAYFLWNGPPELKSSRNPNGDSLDRLSGDSVALTQIVEQMLDDPRRERFVNAFLDYWLDLRDINANTPDAELYPDYYLDELLTESSIRETRMFFNELIDKDLPVRNLVDADFAFVNERLAEHYGFPAFEGVDPRRVDVPADSPYGGLLTQASVLRVTANGTTTSPVLRGVWIMERLVGIHISPPPSGVAAVEPDIRGAVTIREQLDKHRSIDSCNACHARFDPAGFALESFDVAGGWRDRYRATGRNGEPVEGIGKNGHAFKFKLGPAVDCSGTLLTGESFDNVQELKQLLVADERQLARNLINQLVAYATGAAVSFSDRAEVEAMLDRAAEKEYGVRSLIHEVAQSEIFRRK
jgi:mono/diheme cytochrome c family protein